MRQGTTTVSVTADLDDEYDIELLCRIRVGQEDWDLLEITRADDGSEIIPTTDLSTTINNSINDQMSDILADLEGDYVDYMYEQRKDELLMENWYG